MEELPEMACEVVIRLVHEQEQKLGLARGPVPELVMQLMRKVEAGRWQEQLKMLEAGKERFNDYAAG